MMSRILMFAAAGRPECIVPGKDRNSLSMWHGCRNENIKPTPLLVRYDRQRGRSGQVWL